MAIRAVIFDIGGVLEFTPRLGIETKWEDLLGLRRGDMNRKVSHIWRAGSIGEIDLSEVHTQLASALDLTSAQVNRLTSVMDKKGCLSKEMLFSMVPLPRKASEDESTGTVLYCR